MSSAGNDCAFNGKLVVHSCHWQVYCLAMTCAQSVDARSHDHMIAIAMFKKLGYNDLHVVIPGAKSCCSKRVETCNGSRIMNAYSSCM